MTMTAQLESYFGMTVIPEVLSPFFCLFASMLCNAITTDWILDTFFFIKWKFLSFWEQKRILASVTLKLLPFSSHVLTSWSCYTLLCNCASFVFKCCDKDKALRLLLFTDTVKNSNYIHYKFTVTQVTFPHKFIHPFFFSNWANIFLSIWS